MASVVARRLKFSRMRSDRPFPVKAPMRAHISCTTMWLMQVIRRAQTIEYR
jgi:hypothetical protein